MIDAMKKHTQVAPIAVTADAFNASNVLDDISAQGGDAQSIISALSALADAVVGGSSDASSSASASTLAWQQETQSILLNALVNSIGGSSSVSTPRTAALEVSALLAVVQSAEASGQSSLFINETGGLAMTLIGEAIAVSVFLLLLFLLLRFWWFVPTKKPTNTMHSF